MKLKIKDNILNIEKYEISERGASSGAKWDLLDWNESSFDTCDAVREDLQKHIFEKRLAEYPDVLYGELKHELQKYTKVPKDNIEIYNGSDEALRDIFTVFVDDDTRVLTYQPSYTQVDIFIKTNTTQYKKEQIHDPLGQHTYDFEICKDHDVVYLINPNNPTGKIIPVEQIKNLLLKNPNTLFVIDEAYYEYSGVTCGELILSHDNIIVTRTFSKAFGLASLRVGYILGSSKVLDILRKVKNFKSVGALAQVGAASCLRNLDFFNSQVEQVKKNRDFLFKEINKIKGFRALESGANFILVVTPDSDVVIEEFKKNNILIRDRSKMKNLQNCVRITIPSHAKSQTLLDIMKRMEFTK
jgi:histidinol-phosphate aminotransferase